MAIASVITVILVVLAAAGIRALITVTGHRGHSVQFRCPYESGYKAYSKYLCRGACSAGKKDIPVQSGSTAKDQRFSLVDDTAARVFTITITDLRPEDGGTYWCGILRPSRPDIYTQILLLVKPDSPPATSGSTHSPPLLQTPATDRQPFLTTGFIFLYVCVSLLVLGIALIVLILFHKRWKKITTLADYLSLFILQRNTRRHGDQAYYENNLPGTDNSMKIRTVYESVKATRQTDSGFSSVNSSIKQPDEVFQSVTPSSSTIQPDSLYCTVMTRVNHLYPDYQSLIPSTRQSNSDYQTLNPNATKSDSVYQSLTPHTKQVNSIYHTLNPINNQIQSTKTQPQISTN